MLQNIRDKSQGLIAWTIIILLCVAFVVWGFSSYFQLGKSDIIATVNGDKLTRSQLQRVYDHLRAQEQRSLGQAYATQALPDNLLWQQAFNTLLMEKVLYTSLIKLGFYASDDQVNAIIASIPVFLDKGQFSEQRYLSVLGAQGLSAQMFKKEVESEFINGQLRAGFNSSAFVLPNELNTFIALLLQQRHIHYVTIAAKSFAKTVKITPAQIKTYYHQHQEDFKTPAQVHIDYLTLSVDELAKQIKPSQADIQDYYQSHRREYQVTGKPGVILPLSKVQVRVAKALSREKAQTVFANDSEKLANLTYENPGSLLAASKALHLPIVRSAAFTQAGSQTGITANDKVIRAAFSEDVLKNRNNSDVITINPSTAIVLRVAEYQPARVRPLSAVKTQIVSALTAKASAQAAQTAGLALLKQLKQGISKDKLTHTVPVTWQQATIVRDSQKPDTDLVNYAFTLPPPTAKQPSYGGVALGTGGYAVVGLDSIKAGQLSQTGEKLKLARAKYRNELSTAMANQSYAQFLAGLEKQASIKIKDRQFKNSLTTSLEGS